MSVTLADVLRQFGAVYPGKAHPEHGTGQSLAGHCCLLHGATGWSAA